MHVNQHVARGDGHGNRFFGSLSMASRFSDENCTMINGNRRFVMRVLIRLEYFSFKLELWTSMKIGFQNIRLQ